LPRDVERSRRSLVRFEERERERKLLLMGEQKERLRKEVVK